MIRWHEMYCMDGQFDLSLIKEMIQWKNHFNMIVLLAASEWTKHKVQHIIESDWDFISWEDPSLLPIKQREITESQIELYHLCTVMYTTEHATMLPMLVTCSLDFGLSSLPSTSPHTPLLWICNSFQMKCLFVNIR